MAHAPKSQDGHELDSKSPANKNCAPSLASSPSLPFPVRGLTSVDIKTTELTRSPSGKYGWGNFKHNPLLAMLTSHFVAALIQLELLGSGSELSVILDDYNKFSDRQLESGSIYLLKNDNTVVGNGFDNTEIRISWKKYEPGLNSEVDIPEISDILSYYYSLDHSVDLSGSISPSTLNYQLTIESYNYSDSYSSHSVYDSSARVEMATEIHGDLHHRCDELETHWYICSRSRSWKRHPANEPLYCIDISASHFHGSSLDETVLSVIIRRNMRTEAFIQLIREDSDSNILDDSIDRKAKQGWDGMQTSISPQRISLNVDFRHVNRNSGALNYEGTPNQQRGPSKTKDVINIPEPSAAQKNPQISQSQPNSKAGKRRRDSKETESEQLGGETTPKGTKNKRPCILDETGGLACPFYKMDPWKFDRCLTYKMSKMSYVKQHLLRYHDAPHCVTTHQKQEIQRATGRKITSESKWYQIWSILFPGTERPDSPFVKAHYFAEVLSSIKAFYHISKPPQILEKACHQVSRNGYTYQQAFDGLLQRIEQQLLAQTVDLSSPLLFDSNSVGTENMDHEVTQESLNTDTQESLSCSSILENQSPPPVPSPSALPDDKEESVAADHWSEMLTCSSAPQEIPSTRNISGEASENRHELRFCSPNTVQFEQIDWPTTCPEYSGYRDTWPPDAAPQETINYADNEITMCQMGAIFEYTYCPSSPTATEYAEIDAEFSDWMAAD